jgi:rhamnosyltransferase
MSDVTRATNKSGPSRDNSCAVVVAFYPDADLAGRVRSLAPHVGTIVVVDNGSGGESKAIFENLQHVTSATLISNSENRGVAAALNQGIRRAIEQGFQWAVLFDQDSTPLPEASHAPQRAYMDFPAPERIAVIGTQEDDPSNLNKEDADSDGAYQEMKTVITSGSWLDLGLWQEFGGFREDFFIDGVDEEYCLRLKRHGYKVIQTTERGIAHKVGHPTSHRLFGRTMQTTNHSASRRYYMVRNRIRLGLEYFRDQPAWIARYFFYTVKDLLRMLLFEPGRLKKLYAVALGIKDGFLNRMGPLRNDLLAPSNGHLS